MARGRGGVRTPANPAPVSGPSGLSRRTDGGAAPALSEVKGRTYGKRQELEQLEQGQPAPGGGGVPGQPPPGGGVPGGPGMGPQDPFRPSERPGEPITAGTTGPGVAPLTADQLLRILYSKRPSPWLARLLRD